MRSESDVAVRIRTALAGHLKRDPGSIRPADSLRDDLGLDSLAMIELLFRIEEAFDLEIPNEDLLKLNTVGDVTGYIEARLGVPGASPPAERAAPPAAPTALPAARRPRTAARQPPARKSGRRRA
jgi:acyl carrier protein